MTEPFIVLGGINEDGLVGRLPNSAYLWWRCANLAPCDRKIARGFYFKICGHDRKGGYNYTNYLTIFWRYNMSNFVRLLFVLLFLMPSFVLASEILLKSGQKVEGNLLERTAKYVKLDIGVIIVTYYVDEIVKIEEGISETPTKDSSTDKQKTDISSKIKEVLSKFDELKKFSCKYHYTKKSVGAYVTLPDGKVEQMQETIDGNLLFEKPNKVNLTYNGQSFMISDGNDLWFYTARSGVKIGRAHV